MKKNQQKMIAAERIKILLTTALEEVKQNNDYLAERNAYIAKKIAMRLRLRLPYEYRQLYCKRCKKFITPGRYSRIRIGRSRISSIRITCLKCGHTYRKIIQKRKQ
ncbi:MAG TPA: RNase P subunit [Nitrososphaeraceae archaeon]|nr:RNase P subunit [Nitrososphaeraceae archaeon]